MTIAGATAQSSSYGFRRRTTLFGVRFCVFISLILADLLCFGAADLILRLFHSPPAIGLLQYPLKQPNLVVDVIGVIGLIFVVARYLVGDYSRRRLFWDGARDTTRALLIAGAIYLGFVLLLEPHAFLPSCLVWVGLLLLLPLARQGARLLLSKANMWYEPTALIGTSPAAVRVLPALSGDLALGMDIRWLVPDPMDTHIPPSLASLKPILAEPGDLVSALQKAGCRQTILAPGDNLQVEGDLVDLLIGAQIGVALVPSLTRLPLFGLSASYFFGKNLLLLQVRNNLSRLPQRMLKRSIDLMAASAMLVLLLPAFAVIALLIRREDRGPVFFRQPRVGRSGRDFICWKFRTMEVNAEEQLARWATESPELLASYRECNFKLAEDPRVTRIGNWLRCKSLDELPQLVNVLRGDMSFVGPRPLIRRELPDYGPVISLYKRVRPGITGLWQISGRSRTTFADRVSYDEWYIKNWTLWYDIVIMLQTGWILIRGRSGAY